MQPKVYISFSPEKLGAVFALLYCESGADIHGWHIESKGAYLSAAFFMAENFYADCLPRLYRSSEDDVYSPWIIDYPPTGDAIRCPLPEALPHELDRLQSRFIDEWLFFRADPHIEAELEAYREHGLRVQEVNIRAKRLPRLQKNGANWIYMPPGADANVVQMVRKYWRLSEKVPE